MTRLLALFVAVIGRTDCHACRAEQARTNSVLGECGQCWWGRAW